MSWTMSKSGAKFKTLTKSEQTKWDCFQNNVGIKGEDPKTAANNCGDMDYKKLKSDQYQIRLSQGTRATFTVDSKTKVVTVLQVGGHT